MADGRHIGNSVSPQLRIIRFASNFVPYCKNKVNNERITFQSVKWLHFEYR